MLMGREEEGTQERGGCQRQNGTLNTCISNGSEHSELRKETLMLLIDVPKGQNVIRSLKQPPPWETLARFCANNRDRVSEAASPNQACAPPVPGEGQ